MFYSAVYRKVYGTFLFYRGGMVILLKKRIFVDFIEKIAYNKYAKLKNLGNGEFT